MAKFPFTEEGVRDKLTELYALPDDALFLEGAQINANFKNWVVDNFLLSNDQQTYLSRMNDDACDYYGAQCEGCFRYRLDIYFIYPAPPETPGYSKIVESSDTIKISTNDSGSLEVTGALTFKILYRSI